MDEEKLNEIWIALNDMETMFHEMNAVFDVLEVYGDKFDKKTILKVSSFLQATFTTGLKAFLLNIIKLRMTFLNLSKILNKNISVYDKISYSN